MGERRGVGGERKRDVGERQRDVGTGEGGERDRFLRGNGKVSFIR